jgi:hypothetical protein
MSQRPDRQGELRFKTQDSQLKTAKMLCLAMAAFLGVSLNARSHAGEAAAGIELLTEETQEQAIACGKSGADCAVRPYLLCSSEIDRYAARLATPFSRVALSVFEAVEQHQRVRPMEPGEVNRFGVGVYVSPGANFETADSIQRVVIRRANRIIQPTTATLAPITVEHASGARKQLSRGFFAFPMDAFSPTADITIVFDGPSGELSCRLTGSNLAALR